MPWRRFLLATLVGTAVWSAALTLASVALGESWPVVVELAKQYEKAALAAPAVAALAGFLARRLRARRAAVECA